MKNRRKFRLILKSLYINRKWRQFFKRYPMRISFTLVLLIVVINIFVYILWNYYQPKIHTRHSVLKYQKSIEDEENNYIDYENRTNYASTQKYRYFNRYTIEKNVSEECRKAPSKLVGGFAPDLIEYHWHIIESKNKAVQKGHWSPPCKTKQRIAVIIPYRNREKHVKILINNLHTFLQRQERDYGIFVVEQMPGTSFNRAILFNIGFKEALKWYDFNCFVFHDVDLIPENDRNLYQCGHNPTHLSAYIDKFSYRLPYEDLFGGVSSINKMLFQKVNGFSNFYFGWGGEDDDMSKRLRYAGYHIFRYPNKVGAYKMIKHHGDSGNSANTWRFALVKSAIIRMQKDGLNTLEYEVVNIKAKKLMVWIQIQVEEEKMKLNYSIWIKQDFFEADFNYQLKVIVFVLMLFIGSLFVMCFIVICAIKVTPDFHQPLLSNKIILFKKVNSLPR